MSKTYYSLEIDTRPEHFDWIEVLLGAKRNRKKNFWTHDITYGNKRPELTASTVVGHYLNMLEHNYDSLREKGITASDITIWMIYEYDNECNMEFHPEDTKRLGESGIVLCVSCYQRSPDE